MTPSLLHFPKKKERKMRMNKNNKPIGKHSRCLKAIARGGVEATRPILSFFLFFFGNIDSWVIPRFLYFFVPINRTFIATSEYSKTWKMNNVHLVFIFNK